MWKKKSSMLIFYERKKCYSRSQKFNQNFNFLWKKILYWFLDENAFINGLSFDYMSQPSPYLIILPRPHNFNTTIL